MTVPWAGATLEIEAERWLPSVPLDGPFPQYVALGRVTSPARATGPLAIVKGELVQSIARVERASTARSLTVDAQPPLEYYPTEVLNDDPEVYWRLGEGPDALDYSGNSRHGIFENWEGYYQFGQTQLIDGILGQGRRFDDHQVLYSDPDAYVQTVDFTIEFWFQTIRATPIGTSSLVNVASHQKAIGMQTTNSVGYIYGRWGQASSSTRTNMVPFAMVNDGAWHHLVLTRAGSSVRFYVDGVQQYALDDVAAYTPSTSAYMYLASFSPQTPEDPPTPGYDEVAYYSYALTPTQVKRHYNSATQLGEPPLDATYPIGRVTSTPRVSQPLGRAFEQDVEIGRASRSSVARALTPIQGAPPGSPQFVSIGRVAATRIARPLGLQVLFNQQIPLGRVVRMSTARPLVYATGVIYQDDFERTDGNSLGNPIVGGPYGYPFGTSGFALAQGALAVTATGSMHLTVPAAANFDAEVEVRFPGARAGFAFRYQTNNAYWLLRWTPTDLTLFRRSGSAEIVYGRSGPISAGAVLRVVAWGKILLVYLNGRLIFAAEDHYIPTATVGFVWTGDTATRIERAVVKQAYAPLDSVGDLDLETELNLLLAAGTEEAHLFKGRDARLADEGAMA